MRLYILNFDSIPEHIPLNCEIALPSFVEEFLEDANRLDIMTEAEKRLFRHIQRVKKHGKRVRTVRGITYFILPPICEYLKEIESQYENFFEEKTV